MPHWQPIRPVINDTNSKDNRNKIEKNGKTQIMLIRQKFMKTIKSQNHKKHKLPIGEFKQMQIRAIRTFIYQINSTDEKKNCQPN